jgi:hypothetical protein
MNTTCPTKENGTDIILPVLTCKSKIFFQFCYVFHSPELSNGGGKGEMFGNIGIQCSQ